MRIKRGLDFCLSAIVPPSSAGYFVHFLLIFCGRPLYLCRRPEAAVTLNGKLPGEFVMVRYGPLL